MELSGKMLEPIRLGQGRTHCPGLAADERGVVMGRELALFFPDIGRAVGFFRSFTRESALDDLLASLSIAESTSTLGGREVMVRFEVNGSYAADRAAQAARMHKGRVFTGSGKHLISYRDRRSPLGYDLASAETHDVQASDLVLYSDTGADARTLGRKFPLRDMILGLSPRPMNQKERESVQPDAWVLRVEPGLAKEICRYLWSRQIQATIRTSVSSQTSLFGNQNRETHLIRCDDLPFHMVRLLAQTPGVGVFVPVQPHLLIQWGFQHPIALESCATLFEESVTTLFFGAPSRVEQLETTEEGVDIRDLVEVQLHDAAGAIGRARETSAQAIENIGVELRLARMPSASAATQALLIDIERLPWFTKLMYLLPAAVLRTYEAVIADPYIIIVHRRGVHGVPFGEPMTELYSQIFVPVGMQLIPRVDYDLLREHLNIRPEQNLYFFPEGKKPFSVPQEMLRPLSRSIIAAQQARQNLVEYKSRDWVEELDVPTIGHRRQGVFSLWRGASMPAQNQARRALPTPDNSRASANAQKSLPPAETNEGSTNEKRREIPSSTVQDSQETPS